MWNPNMPGTAIAAFSHPEIQSYRPTQVNSPRSSSGPGALSPQRTLSPLSSSHTVTEMKVISSPKSPAPPKAPPLPSKVANSPASPQRSVANLPASPQRSLQEMIQERANNLKSVKKETPQSPETPKSPVRPEELESVRSGLKSISQEPRSPRSPRTVSFFEGDVNLLEAARRNLRKTKPEDQASVAPPETPHKNPFLEANQNEPVGLFDLTPEKQNPPNQIEEKEATQIEEAREIVLEEAPAVQPPVLSLAARICRVVSPILAVLGAISGACALIPAFPMIPLASCSVGLLALSLLLRLVR